MIIIKTKKCIDKNGDKYRLIEKINMLPRNKLPKNYVETPPYCYSGSENILSDGIAKERHYIIIKMKISHILKICEGDKFYDQIIFERYMNDISACGERLKKINNFVEENNEKWKGHELIKI